MSLSPFSHGGKVSKPKIFLLNQLMVWVQGYLAPSFPGLVVQSIGWRRAVQVMQSGRREKETIEPNCSLQGHIPVTSLLQVACLSPPCILKSYYSIKGGQILHDSITFQRSIFELCYTRKPNLQCLCFWRTFKIQSITRLFLNLQPQQIHHGEPRKLTNSQNHDPKHIVPVQTSQLSLGIDVTSKTFLLCPS